MKTERTYPAIRSNMILVLVMILILPVFLLIAYFRDTGQLNRNLINALNNQPSKALALTQNEGAAPVVDTVGQNRIEIEFADRKTMELRAQSVKLSESVPRKTGIFVAISLMIIGPLAFFQIFKIFRQVNVITEKAREVLGESSIPGKHRWTSSFYLLESIVERLRQSDQELREKVMNQTLELKDARDLLSHTIHMAPTGMLMISLDGKYLNVNKAFCQMVGYTREELLELDFHAITHKEDIQLQAEHLKSLELGETQVAGFVKRYILKDGAPILCSMTATLVLDRNQVKKHFFIQVQDITLQTLESDKMSTYKADLENQIFERTRELAEKASSLERSQLALTYLLEDVNEVGRKLRHTNKKLREANRDMEGFSYTVSHDLRAPLRAIDAYSRILMMEYVDQMDEEAKRLFSIVIDNAKKMQQLIDDILALSHLGRKSLNIKKTDLGLMVKKLIDEFSRDETGSRIQWKLKPLPEVYGDPGMINQIFVNLLSNAIKFASRKEAPVITIGSKKGNKGKAILYVQDNGVGFDMKYVDKIFEVFQRLHSDSEFEGTGIGLAIVQRILQKHNGTIFAESEINKGTTMTFTLNLKQ